MVIAALGTLALSVKMFPAGSPIVDERVYIQQGRALAEGALVLPPTFNPDHRPFFTAPNDRGELVFKYTQVWPAVLGASWELTGSERGAIPLAVGGGAVAFAAFVHTLLRRRRITIVATCCFVLSPMWLVLGASYLSYALSLGLGLAAAAALLRTWAPSATGTARVAAALAGLFAGLAVFARPFDAVLLLGPMAVIVIVRHVRAGGDARSVTARVAWHACGAIAPIATLLVFNRRITGSALKLGYSLVGPMDKLGFGDRLDIDRNDPLLHYGPSEALRSLESGLQLLLRWWPGTVVGLALTIVGVWAMRSGWTRLIVIIGLISTPLAYIVVWGAWNAQVRLHSADLMGPYYYLPVTTFAAIGIGSALCRLVPEPAPGSTSAQRRGAWLLSVSVMVLASVIALWTPIHQLLTVSRGIAQTSDALDAMARPGPSLVLVDGRDLGYDVAAYNDVGLDGGVVYALDDPARRISILRRFPDRRVVRLESRYVLAGRPGQAQFRDGLGFDRQRVEVGATLHESASAMFRATVQALPGAPAGGAADMDWYVRTSAGTWSWPFTGNGIDGVEIAVSPTTALLNGVPGAEGTPDPQITPTDQDVCVGVVGTDVRDEVCFVADLSGSQIGIVSPGTPSTAFEVPGSPPRMLTSDVSDRLRVELAGG